MKEPGLDNRHRDKNGEISRKLGNTLVRTLRKIYGAAFAQGLVETEKLSEVLQTLDEPSLSTLVKDHNAGKLEAKSNRSVNESRRLATECRAQGTALWPSTARASAAAPVASGEDLRLTADAD